MTAEVTFRRAVAADLTAIVGLLADDPFGAVREDTGEPLDARYLAAFAAIEANPNDSQVVAVAQGRIIGCLQLSFIPGLAHVGAWRGQVEGVRVAAGWRSQGVGRQMLRWAIERCRERGCRTVQLTTNSTRVDAQRFYIGLGFKASHVGMKLDLGPDVSGR